MHTRKTAVRLIAGLLLTSTLTIPALAATGTVDTEGGTLRVRDQSGTHGQVLATLEDGTRVEVLSTAENGWYQIFYQGKTAYVPSDVAVASTEVDQEALDQEMQKVEEEGAAFVESLETQRTAAQRSRIWQIVIIVLIAAVFITGVISAVKSSKTDKENKNKDDDSRESIKR